MTDGADADVFATRPNPVVRVCPGCAGLITPNGTCSSCGALTPVSRDHWVEQPAPWVAGVCDRGLLRERNDDAFAVTAGVVPGSVAVIAVCDGVGSANNGQGAAVAAANAVRTMGAGTVADDVASVVFDGDDAIRSWLRSTVAVAQAAAASTPIDPGDASTTLPACTFVAAVLSGRSAAIAWLGDSRAYWVPDVGAAMLLTTDHSVATNLIEAGMSRDAAEHHVDAHAITRWMGADAPDTVPGMRSVTLDGSGWFLVASDGFWNYCSDPDDLAVLVRSASSDPATRDVLDLTELLVEWAKGRGGHDNIAIVCARIPAPDLSA